MQPNSLFMQKGYSQFTAMLAITRASLRSILRSPSAVVFSIAFPMVFILVFGFLGNGGKVSVSVAFAPNSDTANPVYAALKQVAGLKIVRKDAQVVKEELEKGRLAALISIQPSGVANAPYTISLTSSEAVQPQNIEVLQSILNAVIAGINRSNYPDNPTIALISKEVNKVPGRAYRTIDFILPGQLGFSLLSSGVFGVAFLFFNLRQQLVLKRFFATPVQRPYIILGEALSRVIFQMFTAIVIIAVGYFAFHFTLVNGYFPEHHGAEFYCPAAFHGLWLYCEQCGQNRKYHSALCQPDYPAAVFAGGYFFSGGIFSGLAATHL